MVTQRYTKLADGKEMPLLGLGTWLSEKGEVAHAIEFAVKNGYEHIDCAAVYGNEEEVGGAFTKLFSSGVTSRDKLFITTKLWNDSHRPADVEEACNKSLKDLQLDYLDLYLMHFPMACPKGNMHPTDDDGKYIWDKEVTIKETWQAMEKLVDEGKTKRIGLSNFTIDKIKDVMSYARIKPSVLQVESHPYLPQPDLVKFCKQNDIVMTAYSPLGSPGLSDSSGFSMLAKDTKTVLENPVLTKIAEKHACTPAQVCISWQIHRGVVVIPKSVKEHRILENAKIIQLDQADMDAIEGIETRQRYVDMVKMVKEDIYGEERLYGADEKARMRAVAAH